LAESSHAATSAAGSIVASSGHSSTIRAQAAGTCSAVRAGVRSAAGRPNISSRTVCTRVPRTAGGLGGSGNRSTARSRYSSGQALKSPARDGDRANGRRGAGRVSTTPPTGSAMVNVMATP